MSTKKEFCLNLKHLDLLIRNGQSATVRSALDALKKTDIVRHEIVNYADLARRVQRPELILRWLRPIVRPDQPMHPEATPAELAIYALGLARIGVYWEALEILKGVPQGAHEQTNFYLGLVHIEQWDYISAQPPLLKYIRQYNISEYQRAVGLLNLAACYVNERHWTLAMETLNTLMELTQTEDFRLLRGNTLELLAQAKIFQNQTNNALAFLDKAQAILGKKNIQYEFFIRKWRCIALLSPDPEKLQELAAIRKEAIESDSWETARECDFFQALVAQDQDRFLAVYFGTHSRAYRKRIAKIMGWEQGLPMSHQIKVGNGSNSIEHRLQLNPHELDMPNLVRSLLSLLLSDLYRPFTLSEAFAKIYSNEYFNPETSTKKIEKLIQRLRHYLITFKIPIDIHVKKTRIMVNFLGPITIETRRRNLNSRLNFAHKRQIKIISKEFGDRLFTAAEVGLLLKISERSARRLLNLALMDRRLINRGVKQGYRIKSAA
jgi:hypothetical protein